MKELTFVSAIWKTIEPVYSKILEHPFIRELSSGTLPEDTFRFYIIQDALFLRDFFRGLALLAGHSQDFPEGLTLFAGQIAQLNDTECELHKRFLAAWKVTEHEIDATAPMPNNLLYTSYLLRTVENRPYHEALGGFLSCFWIYAKVGEFLKKKGSKHPLYQEWIDLYSGDEFQEIMHSILTHAEKVTRGLPADKDRAALADHALRSARLEYLFWDGAYKRQSWNIE